MIPKTFHKILAILWLLPLLHVAGSGCTLLREAIGIELRRPQLSLTDVSIVKANLTSIELALALRVDNPNDFALDFAKLDYTVRVDGIELAKGMRAQKISLPAESHVTLKFPLIVQTTQALSILSKVFTSAQPSFAEVTATADFLTPLGGLAVQFHDKKPLQKLTGF